MRTQHVLILGLALGFLAGLGTAAASTTTAPATANAAIAKSAASAWKPVVPFIEDDFGRALALAKARRLPVFIEGWAPW